MVDKDPAGDLRLAGISRRFGAVTAVADLDLTIGRGSFFALLGPSGCGKSTTLRIIAGLDQPDNGRVRLGDRDITELPPYHRPINTVFQNYALFPHLDVFENVAFGLRRRGVPGVAGQVTAALSMVRLDGLARRRPGQLSGGQQQRVALARALVNRPQVLLLDEPLGALDLRLRREMQLELKRIQSSVGSTFVHVTHDQEEAMTLADTVAVMNAGRIEQLGPPADLYDLPATVFVATFLGQSNLLPGRAAGRSGDDVPVEAYGGRFSVPAHRSRSAHGPVFLGVRPEHLHLSTGDVPAGHQSVTGVVTDAAYVGVGTRYLVRAEHGAELSAYAPSGYAPGSLAGAGGRVAVGAAVAAYWHPDHAFLLHRAADAGEPSAAVLDPAGVHR